MSGDYDYIVVGSGAGGGPLAANLARAGFTVLLLDAGGDPCLESDLGRLMYEVPIFHGLSTEYNECQWDYFVRHYADDAQQKQDSKFVAVDQVSNLPVNGIWYPRAGTLGGCTAHNAMITVTPQNCDWDHIATVTGDRSWRAENMNTYFARLENCHYQPRAGSIKYILNGILGSLGGLFRGRKDLFDWAHGHGFDGWLTTSEADPLLVLGDDEILKLLLSTVQVAFNSGIEHPLQALLTRLDPNDIRNNKNMREGLAFTPLAVSAGKRNGPRDFLLRTAKEYKNLTIQLHSLVTRVLFEKQSAIGVEFAQGKHLYQADPQARKQQDWDEPLKTAKVYSTREVIVAAGAFNSPQLLKLSGVGPAEELKKWNIDVVADLPGVGENLQDRYEVGVISEFPKPFVLLKGATFLPPAAGSQEDPSFELWEQGKGLYTSNGSLIGVIRRSAKDLPEPDLYIFGLPGTFAGYKPGYSQLFERQRNRFTWAVLKAYTKNRSGRVQLRSANPRVWPVIDFNYFSDERNAIGPDVKAVVDGVQFVREMNKALGAEKELWPGSAYDTPQKLAQWVRNEAWGHHASCTNKIGAGSDDFAVLDSEFRVRKTTNLRVVDASVFPRIPGYFIVSAVYMISEKAADVLIKGSGSKPAR